jgi:hypothetical protein
MHSYRFANSENTIVQRDDGATFVWPKGENVANINGRVAEEYRLEGSPKPAPYEPLEPIAAPRAAASEQDRRRLRESADAPAWRR